MRLTYSQEQVARTIKITKLVGDKNNLLILFELMNIGDKSFNELKRMTAINPVTLSKKLSTLKKEGFVSSRKSGKENHYYIAEKSEILRPIIKDIEALVL